MTNVDSGPQDSCLASKIGNLHIYLMEVCRSSWALPIFIILTVFSFNLPYLFVDFLWHDDGSWYFKASEGLMHSAKWRSSICSLAHHLDGFYSYGMVYLGLPVIRGIFVLVMALCSIFLYWLYRNTFGLDSRLALLAAVLPNILPSLIGIPVGLNASYAIWGLLPITLSLLTLTLAFKKRGIYSGLLVGAAFFFYYLGLNLPGQPSSNFLVPSVLLLILMFFTLQKVKCLIIFFPFLGLGAFQIYKQFLYSHRDPTSIPLLDILSRIRKFFEMSDFFTFNSSLSIYLTLILVVFGFVGLISSSSKLYVKPGHFGCSSSIYRLFLIGWPLCWMGANSLAYVAFSPTWRPYDYAYIFNFGSILLQSAGIIYLLNIFSTPFRSSKYTSMLLGSMVIVIILNVGIQRIYYRYDSHKTHIEKTVALIRKSLSDIEVPAKAQIIVLSDVNMAHYGKYVYNSGTLRYIMNRTNIGGLIGPDVYPNDVYARSKGGTADRMRGLDKNKPVIVLREERSAMKRVDFLLQTSSTGTKELPRLQWTLFNLANDDAQPEEMARGMGVFSNSDYLNINLSPGYRHADIAFAPRENENVFLAEDDVSAFSEKINLPQAPMIFEHDFSLLSVSVNATSGARFLEMLLKVNTIPAGRFRLGYILNGESKYVGLWDYVMEGDHILIRTPPIATNILERGVEVGLINASWPPKPLSIKGGPDCGKKTFTVKLIN